MIVESENLVETGVHDCCDRLFIDKECVIITPLHQLHNRVLETLRGEADRYGTTGMGVGVAVNDAMRANPDIYPLGFIGHDSKSDIYIMKSEISTVLRVKDILPENNKFLRNKL